MTRGRLIRWFIAEIAQLDTAATAAAGGYDEVFRTMNVTMQDGVRNNGRKEKLIRLRCQVEPADNERQHQAPHGDIPVRKMDLVFLIPDLEQLGLVDPTTGDPLLRKNDRLVALYTKTCKLVQAFGDPPGMYAQHVDARAYGLGSMRNLVVVTFQDRPQGQR